MFRQKALSSLRSILKAYDNTVWVSGVYLSSAHCCLPHYFCSLLCNISYVNMPENRLFSFAFLLTVTIIAPGKLYYSYSSCIIMYSNNWTVALKIAMPLIVLTTNTIAMKCWIIVSSKNESFFCHKFRSTFYILYTMIFRGFRVEVTMYTWLLKSIPANPIINRVQNGNVCMVVNYVNIQ